jgi:dihydrofolate reductase
VGIKNNRKLVVSMNITLDGYLSRPDCALDWHVNFWTTEMAEALGEKLQNADTLIFGRITYMAMAAYWRSRAMDFSCPTEDRALVHMMNNYLKYVFTNTLTTTYWENSVLINTSIARTVRSLKAQKGGNIIVYGSSQVVAELLRLNAVDEFHLWMHPVTIGSGKALFSNIQQQFRLVSAQTFRSGVVLLIYSTAPV